MNSWLNTEAKKDCKEGGALTSRKEGHPLLNIDALVHFIWGKASEELNKTLKLFPERVLSEDKIVTDFEQTQNANGANKEATLAQTPDGIERPEKVEKVKEETSITPIEGMEGFNKQEKPANPKDLSSAPEMRSIIIAQLKTVGDTPAFLSKEVSERVRANFVESGLNVILWNDPPNHVKAEPGIPDNSHLQEWLSTGGKFLVMGEVDLEPDFQLRITFQVFDLVQKRLIMGKQFEGSISNLGEMLQQFSNEAALKINKEVINS